MDNKYKRHFTNRMLNNKAFDAYDVLTAFCPNNPMIHHAVKKLLCLGGRSGGKTFLQDLKEAIWSLQEAVVEIEYSPLPVFKASQGDYRVCFYGLDGITIVYERLELSLDAANTTGEQGIQTIEEAFSFSVSKVLTKQKTLEDLVRDID